MRRYRIALVPGDGIGKEVVPAGRQVLEALAANENELGFDFESFAWGGDYYRAHGAMMPADGLEALKRTTRSCSVQRATPKFPITLRFGACG